MKDSIVIMIIALCFFISTLVWLNIADTKSKEIEKLKAEKFELLKSLSNEKEDVIKAKKELSEANEVLREVFMVSIEDFEKYKVLKKKCKGSK